MRHKALRQPPNESPGPRNPRHKKLMTSTTNTFNSIPYSREPTPTDTEQCGYLGLHSTVRDKTSLVPGGMAGNYPPPTLPTDCTEPRNHNTPANNITNKPSPRPPLSTNTHCLSKLYSEGIPVCRMQQGGNGKAAKRLKNTACPRPLHKPLPDPHVPTCLNSRELPKNKRLLTINRGTIKSSSRLTRGSPLTEPSALHPWSCKTPTPPKYKY